MRKRPVNSGLFYGTLKITSSPGMNWHRAQRLRSEKIASNARRMELFLVLYIAYPTKAR
jgi:hypothetical protein